MTAFQSKGLFAHAWDLCEEGTDRIMGWMQDSGLNVLCLASVYHSGWFVHPHNPKHRLYMSEGSRSYFQPDEKLYGNTSLRPQVAGLAKETNWLSAAAERLDRYGLRMVAWTVGAHNTDLGLKFRACTQHNAYGDSLPHALSIGHDATREYLKAMCRDLAVNYPMSGIQLESFGWMDARHGHHHERDLTGLTPFEQALLSICFNPETMRKAQAAQIDAEAARRAVIAVLDGAFREAPDRPAGHPATMAELEARSPELQDYNCFRKKLAQSLIHEIKAESLRGTRCKLFVQGGFEEGIAGVCDGFAVSVYGMLPADVLSTVRQGRSRIPGDSAENITVTSGWGWERRQMRPSCAKSFWQQRMLAPPDPFSIIIPRLP